jgi:asparagine synthase (glutamine-hydrolysing)
MCGIYGEVAAPGSSGGTEVLARMAESLAHRGPDDGNSVRLGAGAIGCRRLAIIDVPGGRQPLSNEQGDVIAVCNGEIYNHARLRRDLEARGHAFKTRSDAEVIPHLYEESGPNLVEALDGMFALAVWDARRGRLLLARDRLGEKPLYHAASDGAFLFASEPKALLATGRVDREPDWSAIAGYLRTGWVHSPRSAFAAIGRLPPGGRLVLEGERSQVERYWQSGPFLADAPADLGLEEAAVQLRAHLERAVHAALVSDVPIGIFLSGGLDSTAIAAIASRLHEGISTFALGFEAAGFDERGPAAVAAKALGTRHRTLTVTPALFLEGVRTLARVLDEPLADPAVVPTFLLARFARADVKVVLVGEGGDELFAGYPTYIGAALAARWQRLPEGLRRRVAGLAPLLGTPRGNYTARWLLRRFLEAGDEPAVVRHAMWNGCFSPEALARLASPDGPLPTAPDQPVAVGRTVLDALLETDLNGYLPDDLLVKLDRACMAASLEGRAPFLDHRLVEFACRLPIELKIRHGVTKRVLRRAVADLVPGSTRRRVKRGLSVPLASWLAGPLYDFARDTLAALDPRVVRPEVVRALLSEHVERRRDNRRELWALIMLQLWREAWAPR